LQWNQPYGSLTSNLKMLVFSGGSYLGYESNEGFNTAGSLSGNADIQVNLNTGFTYQIAIENVSGSNPTLIKDMIYNDSNPSNVSMSGANAGTVIGHHMSTDAITVGAVSAANTPAFGVSPPVSEGFSSSGTGTELWYNSNGTEVAGAPENLSPVLVSGVDDIDTSVLTPFYGTSAATPSVAAVVALMLQANPNLTFAQIEQVLQESVVAMTGTAVAGAGLVQANVAVADAIALECFCRGTLILTDKGEVPVEELAVGDKVVTLSGEAKPIKWIGRRSYDGRFIAGNRQVLPIRVAAGALADGVPARDLFVSPEHALFIPGSSPGTGVLVPARQLVNGASIVQADSVEQLEYFNIELEAHDIIFAEAMPAESYVDCDNRYMFQNASEFAALYPGDDRPAWQFCAKRLEEGSAALPAIRAALLTRAEALGYRRTGDPDLHLIVDGEIVRAQAVENGTCRFTIPAGSGAVSLASRSAVPAEVEAGSHDRRRLGVPLQAIFLREAGLCTEIGHGHPSLREGFHDDEDGHRWTDGCARLPDELLRPFAGEVGLEVRLIKPGLRYPLEAAAAPARIRRPPAARG
jgi:hypothetical protein